ncbi:helix-turn-helix domain-containing protein [Streptomyces sp. MAR4 CNX-425]|uniref:helix-turn-helix domain-containing protein n=1 Tax=Streptomyces sp. MAR4 CNX-425 TaxID=3406343 RepID=UPI003B500011
MLRVHFTAADLARTRVADGPDPLWETVLSVHQLSEQGGGPDPALRAWRTRDCAAGRSALRLLRPVMPPRGYFPDFLTPAASAGGALESGIDAVRSTPRPRLRAELARLAARPAPPAWLRPLADGEPESLRRLGRALRAYHGSVLRPAWPWISARTEQDRLWRAQTQTVAGTDAMLRTFGPALRWLPPVLTVDYPADRDLHLGGRGLLLVPSYFCRRLPVALADSSLPPVLVYPAQAPAGADTAGGAGDTGRTPGSQSLAHLLGHTRAAVLQSLGGPCTTSELARRAGVSASSASEHAAVLRRAGLITSTRLRNRVHHSLTPLGTALLTGGATAAAPGLR